MNRSIFAGVFILLLSVTHLPTPNAQAVETSQSGDIDHSALHDHGPEGAGGEDHRDHDHEARHPRQDEEHHDDHHHDDDAHGGHGDEQHKAHIDADMARANGIVTATAGVGHIERHIQVYGRLVTPPGQSAEIRARFAGLVTEVAVDLGERVEQGDLLAEVEANQSLQTYALRAPFAGVIVERAATVGEITGDAPLFHLLNSDTLWAELKIFPFLRDEVKPGLPVHIDHDPDVTDSHIESITAGPHGEPYTLARVPLANPDNHFSPGDLVSALIDAEVVTVPVAVAAQAPQTLDGQTVVFVAQADGFVPRPVRLGRGDGRRIEVLEGLAAGESYVAENSFLVKADLEKASAEHHH